MGLTAAAFACTVPFPNEAGHVIDSPMEVCTERLERLGVQLQQTSKQVEHAVVEVCESFDNIAIRARAEAARLVELLTPADSQAEARSFEHLLRSCSSTLVQLLEIQSKSNQIMETTVARLQKVDESATKIEQTLVQLEHISLGNRMLALNARIEASRLPEHEKGFNAVAVELAAQTIRTNQLTDEVANLSKVLKAVAYTTVEELKQMQVESNQVTTRIRSHVNGTLEGLSTGYETMREAVSQSQEESSLLVDDIALAIRGMQFQDRVSQQLAHVVHDLQVVQQIISQGASGVFPEDSMSRKFSDMVMHEERTIFGGSGPESLEGDIELF